MALMLFNSYPWGGGGTHIYMFSTGMCRGKDPPPPLALTGVIGSNDIG